MIDIFNISLNDIKYGDWIYFSHKKIAILIFILKYHMFGSIQHSLICIADLIFVEISACSI